MKRCLSLGVVGPFVALLLASAPVFAKPEGRIRVLAAMPLFDHSDIPEAVREKCRDLGRLLPAALARGNRDVVLVNTEKELTARAGMYLQVEVLAVRAKGGGIFTGPKNMTIRAVLFERGREIADVEARRATTMAFSACSSLEKVEKTLGQDLARWLRDPRPNDKI